MQGHRSPARALQLPPGPQNVPAQTPLQKSSQALLEPEPAKGLENILNRNQNDIQELGVVAHKVKSDFLPFDVAETGFHHVGQVGLELLTSSDLCASASQSDCITGPTSASQSAGITGVSHCAWPPFLSNEDTCDGL
ncbi:Protein GVQW1 [Plecturocebus cupreus]